MIILLENESGDVNGDSTTMHVYPKIFAVWADDFGGGTVSVEATPDGGTTWIPLTKNGIPLAYTANAIDQISGLIAQGMHVRAVLSGSTLPVNVNAVLHEYLG